MADFASNNENNGCLKIKNKIVISKKPASGMIRMIKRKP